MAAKKKNKTMVVDAGNGNVKASLDGETEVIPSLLSANDGAYIRGGFKLGQEDWILGWDCVNRVDRIAIADQETGKLDYLHLLLSGAVSAMAHDIKPNSTVDLHLLTLNSDKRQYISEQVSRVNETGLTIDNEVFPLTLNLVNLYPEGYGASLYAAEAFKGHNRVAVLDIGCGTLNLSQYYVGKGFPRRESFAYVGAGVDAFMTIALQLMTSETSNGRVDETLLRQAIESNSYRYLSTYEGLHIWDLCERAAKVWVESAKVKSLLIQVKHLLSTHVPVVLAGGGISIACLRETLVNALGSSDLLHTPQSPGTIGVQGLADKLTNGGQQT